MVAYALIGAVAAAVASAPLQLPLPEPVLCAMTSVAVSRVPATAAIAALPKSFFSLFMVFCFTLISETRP